MGGVPPRAAGRADRRLRRLDVQRYQGVRWGWVGFFDTFDDPDAAGALFDRPPAGGPPSGVPTRASGRPASRPTTSWACSSTASTTHPRSYAAEPSLLRTPLGGARLGAGDGPVGLALRQEDDGALGPPATHPGAHPAAGPGVGAGHPHGRFRRRGGAVLRGVQRRVEDNWGFAPMPEPEVRHLAKQLKQIINPGVGLRAGNRRWDRWWGCAWPFPTSTC